MHSSWFTYPISRPYPFTWFTPVTIAGGVVLTAVFTLINLGSSAFYLQPEFQSDPNGTIANQTHWEHNLEPKCEPKMLSVGDSFFTSTLGFQYKINSLWRSKDGDAKSKESVSSIPYLNNTLEDCFLYRASLRLQKSDAIGSRSWWISWSAASYVDATAECSVMTQIGRVNMSLALQYQGLIDHLYGYVLKANFEENASIWWGTRLLNTFLAGVWQIMAVTQQVSDEDKNHYWVAGNIPYWRVLSEKEYVTVLKRPAVSY
ncbi:hypothetical protein N0V84_007050 [Fusarium piperis]|uniref:Uncharacterized protein n=1 Tax=Fusarium piperis TaxID=1435070 RepID=A0A9W8WAV7_9HYPO|nr:hypothetical protein N0V84_007050 [Fusarium piperis]